MKKLCILKIGGSVATYKENIKHTVREDLLKNIFTAIASVQNESDFSLLIVHGAGGHVHHLAHTHQLKTGTCNNPVKIAGALETQLAVTRLHTEIIKIGIEVGLQLVSIPTHTVLTQNANKIDFCDATRITETLSQHKIPVLYGDMVDDHTLGMSICSGDAITAHLTTLLPVTHIFFATDVDGVYTSDPHTDASATLVENLNFTDMETMTQLTESHNTDTTGGLRGKMDECKILFATCPTLEEIHIFNGLNEMNYSLALQNKQFPHTIVYSYKIT